ncbi:MAG: threonine--tRNA ligase [Chloroflexi bacterium]|nr:threonine--tRNA ligase [Chloroflexota bacterium]
MLTQETGPDLQALRHSASHIMAEAVQALFPGAKFGIGPTIESGFYYDFDLPRSLTQEDLAALEAKMAAAIAANLPFEHWTLPKEEARALFAGQPYKLELLAELPDERVSIYRQGAFTDLCRGPHVASTGQVRAFKLLSVAGAYWRGDEKRPMLQRIYGTAFPTGQELEDHLARLAEAERRDHRRLGQELELFSLHEEAGAGLVFWHPKGALVRHLIETFWKEEHLKRGYQLVYIPHISRAELWQKSGHLEFYKDSMYSPMEVDGQDYLIKPMNCPGHILIYKSRLRSYRELPLRWAELGTVYRYERSGVLHGLTRVRGFTQDDAHIFCRPDQLEAEVVGVLELARYMLQTFGFSEFQVLLSTRPEKYTGTLEVWETATAVLRRALERLGQPYEVDPGEGVFYGPKIDIKLQDALGRTWQGPTTQVDFNLPERFDVNYIGEDGREHRAVMVHRTVLGSLERFMGCLIEHYAGAFPLWLAPVQVALIPIADRHLDYARALAARLREAGLRVEVNEDKSRMQAKIREAQNQKIPFMLILGDSEVAASSITVRRRSGENLPGLTLESFLKLAQEDLAARR